MPEVAIEVRGLRKSYGRVDAVAGVDLSIDGGEVFALLGPNGAGKTTTIEILEGFRARSAGDVSVLGHDPGRNERALRERVGIVLQETSLDPYLTVAETIDMFRSYYPAARTRDEILDLVGLAEVGDQRVGRLSGGRRRRLDVGLALSGRPDVLFCDEPTTGFDPAARRNAWGLIGNLRSLGTTVMFTTHYLDEAQALADRVAIIAAGRIVAEGPPGELTAARSTTITFRLPDGAALPGGIDARIRAGTVEIATDHPTGVLHRLTGWALERGFELEGLRVSGATLEDVYLDSTAGPPGG